METKQKTLADLLLLAKNALEFIDALPKDLVLPAMPGFDRDWANDVIHEAAELYASESHQPLSIAWLSDDEIEKKSQNIHGHMLAVDWKIERAGYKKGMIDAQNELKKRVIDPVDFEEWKIKNEWEYKSEVNMWRNKKGIVIVESPTSPLYINTERLLQIYINTKTK